MRFGGAPSLRRPARSFAALLVVVMLVVALAPAAAVAKKKRGRGGPGAGKKRVAIVLPVDAGAAGASLVDKIAKVVKAHGMTPVRGPAVKKAMGSEPPSMDEEWAKFGSLLKADAVVESTMSRSGAKRRLEIVVRNGADGAPAWRDTFVAKGPAKKLAAVVAAEFWRKLGSAVKGSRRSEGAALPARDLSRADTGSTSRDLGSATEPPPLEAASPDVEGSTRRRSNAEAGASADDAAAGTSVASDGVNDGRSDAEGARVEDTGADDRAPEQRLAGEASATGANDDGGEARTVEAELDLRFVRRSFHYSPANAATPYELKLVPLLGAQGSWFPFRYLGVFAKGEFTAALKSGPYPTVTRELMLGAQGRYPFSMGEVSVTAAVFQHVFRIMDTADPTDAPRSSLATPNVTYVGARIGGAARLRLGQRFLLGGEGAYRVVTDPGTGLNEVRSAGYFPNAAVKLAFDAGGFLGFRLIDYVEVRVSADYRRYLFGAQTGRVNVAGIADDYLAINLGLVGVLGGR